MKLVLDTNAYSALMRGDSEAARIVREAAEILLPATVIGELLFGFSGGSRAADNELRLKKMLGTSRARFLPTDFAVCEHDARIAQTLRKKGSPIPTNDLWIAAHTVAARAVLLSADNHFREVTGLNWMKF